MAQPEVAPLVRQRRSGRTGSSGVHPYSDVRNMDSSRMYRPSPRHGPYCMSVCASGALSTDWAEAAIAAAHFFKMSGPAAPGPRFVSSSGTSKSVRALSISLIVSVRATLGSGSGSGPCAAAGSTEAMEPSSLAILPIRCWCGWPPNPSLLP